MLQAGPLLSLSPSFNSYSSSVGSLAEIAARVVSELRRENSDSSAMFLYDDDDELDQPWQLHHDDHDRRFRLHEERISSSEPSVKELNESEDDGEFEFAFAGRESPSSPISADEIFHNGQIRAVYPIFGKPSFIFLEESSIAKSAERNDETALRPPQPPPPAAAAPRRRQPLRKLMVEEEWASCSSSEADEFEGLPSGTYCVWDPKNAGDRKKSKSTGTTSTSKRWTLRDLILSRSNSGVKVAGKGTAKAEAEEKKISAPYNKKELFGFLGNVNGLSRNLHPF